MRKLFTLIVLSVVATWAYAQCGSCTPDVNAPFPSSAFSQGGYYPAPLPPVTQGVFYDTTITFVFPANYNVPPIGNIDVDSVLIENITNLPAGLSWSTSSPTNTFYPQQSQFGCVRICGTTYKTAGIDSAQVTIRGYALGISQAQGTYVVYEVVAAAQGNNSFTALNVTGCDSITSTFEALIDGSPNPTLYDWDFGNGNTSTDMVPPAQTYNAAGSYPVILETTIGSYQLDAITINSVNENWEDELLGGPAYECNDLAPFINTPLCPNQEPDLFIRITDLSSGTVVKTLSVRDNTNPPITWTGIDLDMSAGGPFSISIIDDDSGGNPTSDDLIGTFGLNTVALGTFTFGSGLTTGNYSVSIVPNVVYTDTLNVEVFDSPAKPVVNNLTGTTSICTGDTVVLEAAVSGVTFEWFKDNVIIGGATDSLLAVTEAGDYYVRVTNLNGCSASSDKDTIQLNAAPPTPNIIYQANEDRLATTNGAGYDLQWYFNGVPIPAANSVYYNTPADGEYVVEFTNAEGCLSTSAAFPYVNVGIASLSVADVDSKVYPNPNNGSFDLNIELPVVTGNVDVNVMDLSGRVVYSNTVTAVQGFNNMQVDMADVAPGIYMLQLRVAGVSKVHKVVVEK